MRTVLNLTLSLTLLGTLACLAGCPIHPSVPTASSTGEPTPYVHTAYDRVIPLTPAQTRRSIERAIESYGMDIRWSQLNDMGGEMVVWTQRQYKLKIKYLPTPNESMDKPLQTRLVIRSVDPDLSYGQALAAAIYQQAQTPVQASVLP